MTHFLYMPLTGLGLYGGHRGRRWLRNRIKIFKQFVLPSLLAQTNKNFVLWVSVRHEDRYDPLIKDFKIFLDSLGGTAEDLRSSTFFHPAEPTFRTVFTYAGVCFWDDKFPDDVAHERLASNVHSSMPELLNIMGESKTILMTIQPSDDCYYSGIVDEVQKIPAILNEVHCLIEGRGLHFILTGSSARKLRQQGVNLLAGRALTRIFHTPATANAIGTADTGLFLKNTRLQSV